MLAPTGLVALVQRGEQPDGGVQAGHDVEDRDAGAVRLAVGGSARLIRPEIAWTMRSYGGGPALLAAAEPADRRIHDARVRRGDGVVVEAVLRSPPGRKFSMTMSARRASSRARVASDSSAKSRTTDRLLRLIPR